MNSSWRSSCDKRIQGELLKLGHRVGVHHPARPQGAEDTPGAEAAHRYNLAAVPARARRHDARRRLLPRGRRDDAPAAVLLVRDRSRQPLRHILAVTANPDRSQTTQQIRNLLLDLGDHAADFRFPVRDRAGQLTTSFDAALAGAGIEAVKIPPQRPRANAYAERFVLTARTEVADQMLIFGERHQRLVLAHYEAHYNRRRPHRSRQLHPPRPDFSAADLSQKRIKRRPVLGGLLIEYERAA